MIWEFIRNEREPWSSPVVWPFFTENRKGNIVFLYESNLLQRTTEIDFQTASKTKALIGTIHSFLERQKIEAC